VGVELVVEDVGVEVVEVVEVLAVKATT